MALKARQISNEAFSQWNAKLPSPHLFADEQWLKAYGSLITCVGIFDSKDRQLAGFYYFRGKLKGLSVLRSAPFTPHICWSTTPPDKPKADLITHNKRLASATAEYLDQQAGKQIVSLNLPPQSEDVQAFVWKGFKTAVRYTYHLDLSLQDYRQHYNKTLVRAIAKAGEDELEVVVKSVDPQAIQHAQSRLTGMLSQTDLDFLPGLLRGFCTEANSYYTEVKSKNGVESFALILHNKEFAYYVVGGKLSDQAHNASGSLALDRAIQEAKERGVAIFDFEGSMIPGVEHFFRSFGGELRPYYQLNKASFWKEVLLKWKRPESF